METPLMLNIQQGPARYLVRQLFYLTNQALGRHQGDCNKVSWEAKQLNGTCKISGLRKLCVTQLGLSEAFFPGQAVQN